MNTIGERLKATVFGESHGEMIGIVIDGLPPGITLDKNLINQRLQERRPKPGLGTTRVEPDEYAILSGYYNEKTTGAPLFISVKNLDVNSSDYERLQNTPRPSHADYPAFLKYLGNNDPRGGGVFSGRLTVVLVILGAICEQLLKKANISMFSHLLSIKNIKDTSLDQLSVNDEFMKTAEFGRFPVINKDIESKLAVLIENAKNSNDSLGGVIESTVIGLP
ncbi:MAG: chorismate synthase, partial [Acholeplasmataceae bacterium]|nr:chorismate synthase [Acholeplasmataceae bacterium]